MEETDDGKSNKNKVTPTKERHFKSIVEWVDFAEEIREKCGWTNFEEDWTSKDKERKEKRFTSST